MLPEADAVRLRHMRDAAREAVGYATGRTRAELESDTMLARALVRCDEIVGEAAARTSEETRCRYASLPWPAMIAMRNWLIHAYFDIDLNKVWATITDDLPPLIVELESIVGTNDGDEKPGLSTGP